MNEAEYNALLQTATPEEFVAAFQGWGEKERRTLSKVAQEAWKRRVEKAAKAWDEVTAWRPQKCYSFARETAGLFAVGPKTAAVRAARRLGDWRTMMTWDRDGALGGNWRQDTEGLYEIFSRVLVDRRPPWLGDVTGALLAPDANSFRGFGWGEVRDLVMACEDTIYESRAFNDFLRAQTSGIDPVADDWLFDGPVQSMLRDTPGVLSVNAGVGKTPASWLSLPDAAMERPDQSDHVAMQTYWAAIHVTWPRILYYQQHVGRIPRETLITAAFDAALSDEANKEQRIGPTRFVTLLEPTEDEIAAQQPRLRDMLRCGLGPVVSFSLKQLTRLIKPGLLDVDRALDDLVDTMHLDAATQPKAGLRFLTAVLKTDRSAWPAGDRVLAAALRHAKSDVREAGLKILATRPDEPETDRGAWFDLLAEVPAETAAELRRWLGEQADDVVAESSGAATLDEVRARVAALPDWARRRAGLDEALADAEAGRFPAPFAPPPGSVPVLAGAVPLEPIADVDELVFELVRSGRFDGDFTPLDVERVLDGLSRLTETRYEDLGERVAPLSAAIAGGNDTPALLNMWFPVTRELGEVFARWGLPQKGTAGGGLLQRAWSMVGILTASAAAGVYGDDTLVRPLKGRLRELAERVGRHVTRPALAMPTHAPGWIDPLTLVARLFEYDGEKVPTYEFAAALHRLAPDRLGEAAAAAAKLPRSLREAANALAILAGGDEKADTEPAWRAIAVGRRDDALSTRTFPEAIWTGRVTRTQTYSYPGRPDHTYETHTFEKPPLHFAVEPRRTPGQTDAVGSLRVVLAKLSDRQGDAVHQVVGQNDVWSLGPATSAVPADPAAGLAYAAAEAAPAIAADLSETFGLWRTVVDHLDVPDRAWSEGDTLLTLVGLLAPPKWDLRPRVVDALIEAVADGRAEAEYFTPHLEPLFAAGWAKRNRLVEAATEIGTVSPLHAAFAADLLDVLFVATSDRRHGLAALLEGWHAAAVESGHGPSAAARERLEEVTGSGKAAKTKAKLLSLRPGDRSHAAVESLVGRLRRAERWARVYQEDPIDGNAI